MLSACTHTLEKIPVRIRLRSRLSRVPAYLVSRSIPLRKTLKSYEASHALLCLLS